MGGYKRHGGTDPRGSRRWAFANCIFDEADWTLSVWSYAAYTVPLGSVAVVMLSGLTTKE